MKQRAVTVLVTVKNMANTIAKCIDSLMRLNYDNYRVYVTDAFSTDGTWEILKELKKKYGRKLVIERVKGNIAKAHNYMLRKVKTPFVAFTDADCVVDRNWLKELMKGFTSKEIVATAGYSATPKEVNWLQRLIGKELEARFKRFPEFISRAPTMNLCVRTRFAKKVKFDERLDVTQETDFGWRLTKLGKMRYVPKALVWHYHRPTLKSYFMQQFRYGKFLPLLYLKHPSKARGDHISTPVMMIQEAVFSLSVLLLILWAIFKGVFYWLFIFSSLSLLVSYLKEAASVTRNLKEILALMGLLFIRNVAWSLGFLIGLFKLVLRIF